MSNMSNLYGEIEYMLERGDSPQSIARILEVPASWVYEVLEEMQDAMPEPEPITEEELDAMAEFYGYGNDSGCEFDR